MKFLLLILLFLPMSMLAQSSFENGEKCFKSGKYELAKSYFLTSLKQNPNDLNTIE
jgi:hypothetical protein